MYQEEIRVPKAIINLIEEYNSGEHHLLNESVMLGLTALSYKIYRSIYGQMKKLYFQPNQMKRHERLQRLNQALTFTPNAKIYERFLGVTPKVSPMDHQMALRGYRGSRSYLLQENLLEEIELAGRSYNQYRLAIGAAVFDLNDLRSWPSLLGKLNSFFIPLDYGLIKNKKLFEKKMEKRLTTLIGNYQHIRLALNLNEKQLNQVGLNEVNLKDLRLLDHRLTENTFKARKSFKVKRFYTELAGLKKSYRSLLYDAYHGEQMVEIDYHALHPMILKGELWQFYEDSEMWADKNEYELDKSNKSDLRYLLNNLSDDEQLEAYPSTLDFKGVNTNILDLYVDKSQSSNSSMAIEKNFEAEFKKVFNYAEDFYTELLKKLDLDLHPCFQQNRKAIKVCVLQLLHGQQWRGNIYWTLVEGEKGKVDTAYSEDDDHQSEIKKMTAGITESNWTIFYQQFCKNYPTLAFGLAYFQYCVSLKDLDAKERGKYLGFSRLLFSKEVALIEDVILHLKSNTSHQRKHKVRSLFESIGYPEWDGSSYAMFPIYDCVSVPRSISKVTSQLMEAVGRKHQFELRAEIEAPAVHVSTHDLPKSILQEQAHLHRVKGQPRAFTMTDMVRCHFKMEGWHNTEKEFFNLQYNQKSIRIRRRKDVSLYESFSSIEKALSKVGYALDGEAIVRGCWNPIWQFDGASERKSIADGLIINVRKSSYGPFLTRLGEVTIEV